MTEGRMRAGPLRHEIVIQSLSNASTDLTSRGQTLTPTWTTVATVRASIEPLSGTELFNARQLHPKITHRIRTRYVDSVNAKCRATFGSRTFHFHSAVNVAERSREIDILAEEEV